jgi:hypothetical protein
MVAEVSETNSRHNTMAGDTGMITGEGSGHRIRSCILSNTKRARKRSVVLLTVGSRMVYGEAGRDCGRDGLVSCSAGRRSRFSSRSVSASARRQGWWPASCLAAN